jgi:hypothetical protein
MIGRLHRATQGCVLSQRILCLATVRRRSPDRFPANPLRHGSGRPGGNPRGGGRVPRGRRWGVALSVFLVLTSFATLTIAADRCTTLEVEVQALLQASPQTIEQVRAYEWCRRPEGTFYLLRRETIRVDKRLRRLRLSDDGGPEILFDRAGETPQDGIQPTGVNRRE